VATRRIMLSGSAAAGLLALFASPAPAAEDPALAQAVAFIRDAGNRLANLTTSATSPQERQARLVAFLNDVVDFDGVARFCLGRFWRNAAPQQQNEYLDAFRQVVTRSVTSRMGGYSNGTAKITIGQPTRQGDTINVPTVVEQPGSQPLRVVWVVSMENGSPRIADLIAEGVSLRVTQRSDYAAFLQHNNNDVGALIAAMRKQESMGTPAG
jgi:phospholipid transport system substrate-binding protein